MKFPHKKKSLLNLLLIPIFLLFANVLKSQQTFTQIGGWNAYVHLPANYSNTTISYPTIIFFPGIGEVGTNASALISNGPGAYITQGWNGNVLIDGNTVEFIVISLQPPAGYPNELQINQKIQTIKSNYRVNNNKLYLTGLSHGGWCSTTFVTGDAYGGPYTYASQIAAVVEVQGVIPDDNSPYPGLFDNFANAGGRLLGFEQIFDNRGMPTRVNRMNATVPNSAIYKQTNFGGGGHCCWNQFYGGQGTTPGNFLLDGVNQNLYQWLARQSLVTGVNQLPVANAGIDKVITLPVNSTTLDGSGTDPDGSITSYLWTKIAGPTTGIIANATNQQANLSALVQGIYQYELKVTDNAGGIAKDSVIVTVNSGANLPPTVNAGLSQTITLPINSVALNGAASDPDGTISNVLWTKISGPASAIITNPSSLITTVTALVQGNFVFQLTVTDNAGATASSTVNIIVNAQAAGSCNLTAPIVYTIAPTSPNEIYITNASNRPWKGGDTLNILAGTYSVIQIDSFGGDPCRDIVIRNVGGLVNVNGPIRFNKDVHHVKVIGNGTSGIVYGFKCTSFAMGRVNHFTMDKVETGPNPGGVGIYCQQPPYIDNPATHYPNYVNRKITINNCYVHDVAGEGMYIGNTAPDADPYNNNLIPQRLDSVTISNNIVTNTGWDGIQLSNARNGCLIFGNTVTNFGTTNINGQRAGIISGGNTNSKVYNNTITNGTGNGIQFFGYGPLECYNNTITNAGTTTSTTVGEQSIYGAAYLNHVETNPRQAMIIHDNQINYPKPIGAIRFWDTNNNADPANVYNNKFCFANTPPTNWQALNLLLPFGFTNINNTLFCVPAIPPPNQLPTANAGADITITLPINTASLNGTGTDPDGTIISYAWTKIAGPTAGTLANATSASATASGLVQGLYQYELRVTDNAGGIAKDTMQVTVNAAVPPPPPNQLPTANAGADITITLPVNTASLNGTGTDPDGTIVSYAWTKIAGPTAGTLANATSASATASGLVQGLYQYELKVTDNAGGIAKDTMQVTVNAAIPPPNQLPTANAGADITITLPINTASVNGTGTDPDGTIVSYAWTKIAGPTAGTLANATSASATASGLVQGLYQYELTVIDNAGGIAKDTMQVTVNAAVPPPPPNQLPTANAGTDLTITLPISTASLNGTGTDPDGTIVSYAWTKISGPAAGTLANATSASATASGLVQGLYQYELTVIDNAGGIAKDTMQVTMNAAVPIPNQLPTANAGTDLTITLPINTASLNGTGTDPDGTIVSYAWTKIAGPTAGTLANATSASATASGLMQGLYQYELRVTDNAGGIAKDTMQVTVNAAVPPPPPNQLPTANAGADITITLPVNTASLNGTGTDPDGTIVSYAWTKIAGPTSGNIFNEASATASLTNLMQGIYIYQLTVTDNFGAKAKDTIQVTVNLASNQVNVFPNPAKNIVNVEIRSIGFNDVLSLVLRDGKGANVYEKGNIKLTTNGIIEKIDMGRLKAGLYFLKIIYGNGSVTSKKIIKL
jgi:Secretion system C-terminal sorting domain/Right handed beta helix region